MTKEEIEALKAELKPFAAKLTINVDNLSPAELLDMKGLLNSPVLKVMSQKDPYQDFIEESLDVLDRDYKGYEDRERAFRMIASFYDGGLSLQQVTQLLESAASKTLDRAAVDEFLPFFYPKDGKVSFDGKAPVYYAYCEFYSKGKTPTPSEQAPDRYDVLYEEEARLWIKSFNQLMTGDEMKDMLSGPLFKDPSRKKMADFAIQQIERRQVRSRTNVSPTTPATPDEDVETME